MTKVNINPTPTQELIAKAQAEVSVKDARGRVISLRKPPVLAQYRIVKVLGESASNRTYVNMVMPLLYVSAIDGDPVPAFARESEIEAMIVRLDDDGLSAVMEGIAANFGAADPEAEKAALKN